MRISVINLTHGLLSDTEVITSIRAINRQIKEDFEPYWNMQGQLRLEGNSSEQPDTDHPEDMQGEAIIYLWDKADVPNALGYHDANYRGIPYGFVFVDIASEIGENWTVTFSHEVLELIGDRQAGKLIRGPHPHDKNRTVYHWHEMCDAVQDETYEIDGIEVSNFVLPLYFTEDAEPGSRNDFLGTQYLTGNGRNKTSLPSFGINPGGYIGFFDHLNNQHETVLGPDLNAADRVKMDSTDRAAFRKMRKNKARLLRRGNRYVEMDHHVVSSPQKITAKKKQKLGIGARELTISCATDALTIQTDVALLSAETRQGRGYFAHDIYADANDVNQQLQESGFDEIAAIQIEPVIQQALSSPPKAEIGIKHSKDEAVIALVEVDGVIFWQQPDKTSRGTSVFEVTVQAVDDNLRSRRGFLIKGAKTLVRFIRHNKVVEVKEWVTDRLNDYLTETVEQLAFGKSNSTTMQQIKLLKTPINKTIGEITDLAKKLPRNKKYLLLIHGVFSSSKGTFSDLLLNRWEDNLLNKLNKKYDKIISFDHWTVAQSTLENATELLAKLPKDCAIDIICHGRGAGVARCLLEHPELAPKLSNRSIKVGKVIFVGGACQGSPLANPDKIGTLVNVFSALSSVTGNFLPLKLFTGLLKAMQYGVNNFPGIESMAPDSPLFTELNKPINQTDCEYIYIRSNYEPSGKLKQMLDELALDKFVFENEANDGVVPFKGAGNFSDFVNNTITVTAGPEYGIKQKEHVCHNVFFEQQEVRQALINHLTK